jgi:hypothetical protein
MSAGIVGLSSSSADRRAKIFLSHSSKDHELVSWLAAQVEAAGHQAWVAEWEHQPGESLSQKVRQGLAECDAYMLLLTQDGYDAMYVAHESGAALTSGKPVIALVERSVAERPLGMLAELEQVRFDAADLSASTAAITAGLRRIGDQRGLRFPPEVMLEPTPPALAQVRLQMDAQFQATPEQVLIGALALMLAGGLIYLAVREAAS